MSLRTIQKVCSTLIVIFLWHTTIIAQNLLPNGGFEKLNTSLCNDPDDSFIRLQDWYPLDATPDLFVGNCTYEESDFIFWDNNSKPYEGRNFVGIWSRWNSNSTYFSEGIATRFVEPLEAGETYLFQMMIRNMGDYQGLDASVSGCSLEPDKHIDIYISEDSITIENNFSNGSASTTANLVSVLQSENIAGGGSEDWTVVSTCFMAAGGEKYLGIVMPLGTFGDLPECAIVASSGVFRSFYYQIDNVYVNVMPEEFSTEIEKCEAEIIEFDIRENFDLEFLEFTLFQWEDGFEGALRDITEVGDYNIRAELQCGTIGLELKIEERDCSSGIYVPNAFSPNDDGRNDALFISLANMGQISNFSLKVFDRWGGIMYSTTDPTTGWDGRKGGEEAAMGTYILQLFYELNSSTGSEEIKINKSILLIR